MVFFICNNCGESLKKHVVVTHAYRCKRDISVSCMDCQKDFTGETYNAHTSCITEEEKYSSKDFVAKEKKGAKKQENWIVMVRAITERKTNLPNGVMTVFEFIKRNDNVPRKSKGFMNFCQNSCRQASKKDVEMAWALIQEEVEEEKKKEANSTITETLVPTKNGTTASEAVKNVEAQKRKMQEDESSQPTKQKKKKANKATENGQGDENTSASKKAQKVPQNGNEVEVVPPAAKQKKQKTKDATENEQNEQVPQVEKQKKRKTKRAAENGHDEETALLENGTNGSTTEQGQNGNEEQFNWSEVIRNLIVSKNNEMKLSMLKKKVMKRYQQLTGAECDGKFEKKFHKKIAKAGLVVENDTVRLVEA
uniref:Uncharacterized protein n=1 Tax=Anopheles christyi TaxID=43041 RepID=A0A182JUF7_9DIPT